MDENWKKTLKEFGFDDTAVAIFEAEKLDRELLRSCTLDRDDLKDLGFSALGDRKRIESLQAKLKSEPLHEEIQMSTNDDNLLDELEEVPELPPPLPPLTPRVSSFTPRQSSLTPSRASSLTPSRESSLTPSRASSLTPSGTRRASPLKDVGNTMNGTPDNVPSTPQQCKPIPDRKDGWEASFVVPTQYSEATMHCIQTGRINSKARSEIVQSVHTRILNICKMPTKDQLRVVAMKIKENIGCNDMFGVGFESWVNSLDYRFRNMRRPNRAESIGVAPPSKRKKVELLCNHGLSVNESTLDQVTLERSIQQLSREVSKSTRNEEAICVLMHETSGSRRSWIVRDVPKITEVLEVYAPLKEYDYLVEDLATISQQKDLESKCTTNWSSWRSKILEYSKMESNMRIREIMRTIEDAGNPTDDYSDCLVLEILTLILDKRKSNQFSNLIKSISMPSELSATAADALNPVIIRYGNWGSKQQFFLVAERELYLEVDTFPKALVALIGLFFVYNMKYTKQCSNTLHFIQRILLEVITKTSFSKSISGTLGDINNV